MHVDGLLPVHRIEELEGGLPRANVGPSDHIGIMVRSLTTRWCSSSDRLSPSVLACQSDSKLIPHRPSWSGRRALHCTIDNDHPRARPIFCATQLPKRAL